MDNFHSSDCEQSLAKRFETWAEQAPNRIAFRQSGRELSYDALNKWSNRLAHALSGQVSDQKAPVALLLGEPIHHVVAQLGTLKAGGSCVPIDVSFPLVRQNQILKDSGAQILITERKRHHRDIGLAPAEGSILFVDALAPDIPDDNLHLDISPDSPAYVLYTSGSTGRPKGIVQSHRNLLHVAMLYHRDLGVGPVDRVTTPTSPAYTGTVWALLSALMNGAAFVYTSLDSPAAFVESIAREKVTVLQLIASLLRQLMLAVDGKLHLPELRVVYTGGETFNRADVKRFASIFPDSSKLVYDYGSTEAGIVTHHHVDLESVGQGQSRQHTPETPFPVGRPVEDTEVFLVDENGEIVEGGQDGEIVVRSRYLSPGYWGDAVLTRLHFLPDPAGGPSTIFRTGDLGRILADGSVIHLGRKDDQVKVRGYRINLAEIEETLRSVGGVAAAAARYTGDPERSASIVAYIQREESYPLSTGVLRERLEALLPAYMVPSLFIYLEHLPLSANGKLDRNALPSPDCTRPELETPLIEPKTPTEIFLCRIFSEVFNIEPIGVLDNFIELGGNSIIIFQLIARIKSMIGKDISPRIFFETPIIGELARVLDEQVV